MKSKTRPEDPGTPVAYDQYGRPLYAHPPANATANSGGEKPQVVYLTRAIEPHQQEIPAEIKQMHQDSLRRYPNLNLSDGEYVISAIRRHPIGVISIWVVVFLAILLTIAVPMMIFSTGAWPFRMTASIATNGVLVLALLVVLLFMGGIVATIVYDANRFYLTNESVIQDIQTSLFHKKNQTISLGNVEDASYRQSGIIQTLLNYGSIRLSTEGEETTYRFSFVANPQEQIRLLNDAVEAFKNFRPIDHRSTDT